MPLHYYAVRETDSYTDDVTLHADRDCPEGPVRAAPPTVSGAECPECIDAAEADPDPDICTVELSAGGECGREKPCVYHD